MNATPRAIPITPSVAMNGGSPTRTMSHDETRPAATPVSRPAATLGASGHPLFTNKCPVTTLVNAMTAPGARSIPPEMMTIAAPMAAMP